RNSQVPEPARRTTWTFRSSSGRCAPSRHQAEGHHQVLIVAPSPTLPIDAAIPSSVPAVFTAVGGVPGVDLDPGAPSTFRFAAQNRDEPPQRRQLCFAITVGVRGAVWFAPGIIAAGSRRLPRQRGRVLSIRGNEVV